MKLFLCLLIFDLDQKIEDNFIKKINKKKSKGRERLLKAPVKTGEDKQ